MEDQPKHIVPSKLLLRARPSAGIILWLAMILLAPAHAQQPETNFSQLLEKQMRQVFTRICDYVRQHPGADDIDSAYRWIFQVALEHGFETDVILLSQQYLEQPEPTASTRKLAQQVLVLGQARQGKIKEAESIFLQYLKEQPAYTAEQNISFALQFALAAQLHQQYQQAADIYAHTARRFTLNPQVRNLCVNKIAKLKLINEIAPPIAALDISGQRIDISSYRGKILLIDFWATYCPPCLEALPHMKRLYEKYHPQGLEILGISLDIHRETVSTFQRKQKIPWRMMMIEASPGSLRQPYKVAAIPSLYLVNREGKVVQFDLSGRDLSDAIARLMESPNQP